MPNIPEPSNVTALITVYLLHNTPGSVDAQQAVLCNLIEVGIAEDDGFVLQGEVASRVNELLDGTVEFTETALAPAIRRLADERRLGSADGCWRLSERRAVAIREALAAYQADERHFAEHVLSCVSRAAGCEINPIGEPLIVQSLQAVVIESARHRRRDLDLVMATGADTSSPINYDALADLRARITPVCETVFANSDGRDTMSRAIVQGCCHLFRESDDACRRYLEGLYSKVLYHQLIAVDPVVQKTETEAIAAVTLFLDTNIVVDVLIADSSEQRAVCEILDISRKLGTRLVVTAATLRELGRQLTRAGQQLEQFRDGRLGHLVAERPGRGVSPFFVDFNRKRRANRNLTWGGYVAPFSRMENLLQAHGINVEAAGFDKVNKDRRYELVWNELRGIRQERYHDDVVEHDALNCIYVQRLRDHAPGNVLFTSSVWLLTRDSNLARLDDRLSRTFRIRHSKSLEQWGASMLSFQHLTGFQIADYVGHLVKTNFGVAPREGIDASFAYALTHPEFDIERLSELDDESITSVLIELQGSEEARRLAEQLDAGSEAERIEAGRELSDKAWSVVVAEKRVAEKEVARLNAELAETRELLRTKAGELEAAQAATSTDVITPVSEVTMRDQTHRPGLLQRLKKLIGRT